MKKKNKDIVREHEFNAAKRHGSQGVIRRGGKVLLATAAYQILAVGMISANLMGQVPNVVGRCVNPIAPPPSTGGGGGSPASLPGGDALYQGSYQFGQALGKLLFGDPQAEQQAAQAARNAGLALNDQGIAYANKGQWQDAYSCFQAALQKCPGDANIQGNLNLALKQLQAEAKAAKDRKDQETYNRLSGLLKQSGTSASLGLKDLKTGDSDDGGGTAGIKGLPGIYLNDDTGKGNSKPYGIPGLPGIYVNGPGAGSGLKKLPLMLGDENTPAPATPISTPSGNNESSGGSGIQGLPGLYLNGPASNPSTSQQPAGAKLPLMMGDDSTPTGRVNDAVAQPTSSTGAPAPSSSASTQPPSSLKQQANASQSAANAGTLEDASSQARSGFDTPLPGNNTAPVQLGNSAHNDSAATYAKRNDPSSSRALSTPNKRVTGNTTPSGPSTPPSSGAVTPHPLIVDPDENLKDAPADQHPDYLRIGQSIPSIWLNRFKDSYLRAWIKNKIVLGRQPISWNPKYGMSGGNTLLVTPSQFNVLPEKTRLDVMAYELGKVLWNRMDPIPPDLYDLLNSPTLTEMRDEMRGNPETKDIADIGVPAGPSNLGVLFRATLLDIKPTNANWNSLRSKFKEVLTNYWGIQ